jgi:hypothetical protein
MSGHHDSGERGPYWENDERCRVARREGWDRLKNTIFCSWRLAKSKLMSIKRIDKMTHGK